MFWIYVLLPYCPNTLFCNYFLPDKIVLFCFHSLNSIFCRTNIFNFNKVQMIRFFFKFPFVYILKHYCQTQGHLDFSPAFVCLFVFPLKVLEFCVSQYSVVYLELIFYGRFTEGLCQGLFFGKQFSTWSSTIVENALSIEFPLLFCQKSVRCTMDLLSAYCYSFGNTTMLNY